ncbi:hypothetical protein [Mycetocola reblochoni]|uniref:hypothetical protein n=1 Tax=Mycetocola reblochoni TaxID=331618 RepID=UPI0011C46A92|nr:hypothetical protein [Mycetocola reblochoni]
MGESTRAYPDRISLSDTAEHYLGLLADDLQLGRVELHQLPPSLAKLIAYAHQDGYDAGRRSRDTEVENLTRTADHWYLRANNTPAQAREIMAARVDQGLIAAFNQQLHEAALTRDQPASGDDARREVA